MLLTNNNRKNKAFTFVELMVAVAIFSLVFGLFAHWFWSHTQYRRRLSALSNGQQTIRRACWLMIQEMQTARSLIWPRADSDNQTALKSDHMAVIVNFEGQIVAYYFAEDESELRRVVITSDADSSVDPPSVVGTDIDNILFTSYGFDIRSLGIFIESNGAFGIESVFLINE